MLFSKFSIGARLKNGVTYKAGRKLLSSQTPVDQPPCSSTESEKPSVTGDGDDENPQKMALILRVFQDSTGKREFGPFGQKMDKKTNGKLTYYLKKVKLDDFKVGDTFVVPDVDTYGAVALSCAGPKDAGVNEMEAIDEKKENIRCSFAAAYHALNSLNKSFDDLEHEFENTDAAQAAHEGYYLAKWRPKKEFRKSVRQGPSLGEVGGYIEGEILADSQNFARYLSLMPPNELTPGDVAKVAQEHLTDVSVKVYEKNDIKEKKMTAFLAVAKGSSAKPKLLVCQYKGTEHAPRVLMVAKGLTFDSGGLCLKKPADMLQHCGMTGAAVALGTMKGVAALKLPVNLMVVIPLCENMISSKCLKVGDVVHTLKGHNVKIEDTDLVGHLMLADALTYGQNRHRPKYVINVASLTPGIAQATGTSCYGCFTNNEVLWQIARDAGIQTGDRPWRFPIWNCFAKQITGKTALYDLKNRGSGIASHCIGAAFLKNFVSGDWLHYDITGVGKMAADEAPQYLDPELMTGRPTRAVITAIKALGKKSDDTTDETSGCQNSQV